MANSPQARKRARQAEKRRQHNAAMRSMVRTYIKKVNAAIASGDQQAAQESYTKAVSVLDKATRKGKFHANQAARYKSRLNSKIKAMGSAA
ncbi:MAG TPA: 30S ribosomal protein S20 [Alcanivoracaceae bacterium]|nr:30S ribosomal protein S20 [Alcanivoracaceae bacterium]